MTTVDAIMLSLYERKNPLNKTALFRAAAGKIDLAKRVDGPYGDYPEDGYDALEFLDNLDFIRLWEKQYSLTVKGDKFCKEVLLKKDEKPA